MDRGAYATGAVPLHNEPFLVGDEMGNFFNAFSRQQALLDEKGNELPGYGFKDRLAIRPAKR